MPTLRAGDLKGHLPHPGTWRIGRELARHVEHAVSRARLTHPSEAACRACQADRAAAADDRARAAHDLEVAAALRAESAVDRARAIRERQLAGTDQLTGVSLRSIGLTAIEREIQRARRTDRTLVLAFLDVNDLKTVNDAEGHLAGDALLREVANTLKAHLRPYDVIVRFGGDEFVCALSNVELDAAQRRFEDVVAALPLHGDARPAVSYGLAVLGESDDLEQLIAQADQALLETRRSAGRRS